MRVERERQLHRAKVYGPEAVKTWPEAVARYVQTNKPSRATKKYLSKLTRYFGPRKLLKDIDQDSMDGAVAALCEEDAAPGTQLRNVIGPARAVLTVAAGRKWCSLPVFKVPDGATGNKRTRWLRPAEYHRLADAAAPHLRPLIVFLIITGARISEALALVWEDVDLEHGQATLREVKAEHGVIRDRTVDLPAPVVAALSAITYPGPPGEDRKPTRIIKREGVVFRTHKGVGYKPREDFGGQVKTAWATAARKAGFPGEWHEARQTIRKERRFVKAEGAIVERQWLVKRRWWTPTDVTPHVLRHTFATWHYAIHRDPLKLKEDGDWSSVDLVERYAKLAPASMVPAIKAAIGFVEPDTQTPQRLGLSAANN